MQAISSFGIASFNVKPRVVRFAAHETSKQQIIKNLMDLDPFADSFHSDQSKANRLKQLLFPNLEFTQSEWATPIKNILSNFENAQQVKILECLKERLDKRQTTISRDIQNRLNSENIPITEDDINMLRMGAVQLQPGLQPANRYTVAEYRQLLKKQYQA